MGSNGPPLSEPYSTKNPWSPLLAALPGLYRLETSGWMDVRMKKGPDGWLGYKEYNHQLGVCI